MFDEEHSQVNFHFLLFYYYKVGNDFLHEYFFYLVSKNFWNRKWKSLLTSYGKNKKEQY